MEHRIPTKGEVLAYLEEDRNLGRWVDDDQKGTKNRITWEKRPSANAVRSRRAGSLSREFPKTPATNNPTSASAMHKRPTNIPNTTIFRHR